MARKALVSSSHVVIDHGGRECSHALALSLSENGNRCREIASVVAPLISKVSHTCRNTEKCKLGFSISEHQTGVAGPWRWPLA